MTDDLFGGKSTGPREKLSADRERTIRAKARIERGLHPFGLRLRSEPGETCGTCAHLCTRKFSGTYFKCGLVGGTGPATDLRKSWPACDKWAAKGVTP